MCCSWWLLNLLLVRVRLLCTESNQCWCAQLLVTPRDFRDPSFKANLRETTEELLNMARVVPVFNENDAISDRTRARPAHK